MSVLNIEDSGMRESCKSGSTLYIHCKIYLVHSLSLSLSLSLSPYPCSSYTARILRLDPPGRGKTSAVLSLHLQTPPLEAGRILKTKMQGENK